MKTLLVLKILLVICARAYRILLKRLCRGHFFQVFSKDNVGLAFMCGFMESIWFSWIF